MARQEERVLEDSGAFERFRDPVRLWGWLGLALVLAGVAALAVVNFDAIAAEAAEYKGRRAGARGLVAPGAVAIPALGAVYAVSTAIRASARWRDRTTGEPLSLQLEGPAFVLAAEAGRVHQRFASGDPRSYLPLEFRKGGQVGVAVHTTTKGKRAFVSITEGYGKRSRPLPLIVLEGGAYEAIKDLEGDDWRRGASPQTISSFLDPPLR